MQTGLIFDIKKYAINDGPGIRLTVFFKGCNLACEWCHNPESISPKVQKMYTASKCIGAVKCIENCPNDALIMTDEGIVTDYNSCNYCGICAEVQSGGGVTFSGGEPLMHADYLLQILKACGKRFYHRVVDTTAFSSLETILEVAKHTELFLIDLKVMDADIHKRFTGVNNEKILRNITELAKTDVDIIFRIPLIKEVNAYRENIIKTAEFINALEGNRNVINLLPYHKVAENKHKKLGNSNGFIEFKAPTESEIEEIISVFKEYNITASVGG